MLRGQFLQEDTPSILELPRGKGTKGQRGKGAEGLVRPNKDGAFQEDPSCYRKQWHILLGQPSG